MRCEALTGRSNLRMEQAHDALGVSPNSALPTFSIPLNMPKSFSHTVGVIGAGLAGCECAFALAMRGFKVSLFEMKPHTYSPAHNSPELAELVCSNSLRSNDPNSAVGLLKQEMRALGSLVMEAAEHTQVPAGKALAVDRELFSRFITARIEQTPGITLVRREITSLNPAEDESLRGHDAIVLSAGPVASDSITKSLERLMGGGELYFYDAIAPIVSEDSLDMSIIFRGSRYSEEAGDYLNCPMDKEEYFAFHAALLQGTQAQAKDFEEIRHFEGCMPIEALAERGERTLAFGPFKPVGFIDPRTGRRPFAIVQLRAENLNHSMYNMVGCQTRLLHGEQKRIFSMIPGMEHAHFVRYGSMHRNTFVNAPQVLNEDLSLNARPDVFLAGQITGVEGYVESAACGLWLGLSLAARFCGNALPRPPAESALGALLTHLQTPAKRFQPSNIQFGLMPELDQKAGKHSRRQLYAERGRQTYNTWLNSAAAQLVKVD